MFFFVFVKYSSLGSKILGTGGKTWVRRFLFIMYKGEGDLRKEEVTPFWSLSSANNSAVTFQVIHDYQPKTNWQVVNSEQRQIR